jgi:hypothetical protein
MEAWRQGDREAWKQGDKETGRQGDKGDGRNKLLNPKGSNVNSEDGLI